MHGGLVDERNIMPKNILYVDACVNRDTSRTERLAQALLARLQAEQGAKVTTVVLEDLPIEPLGGDDILRRTEGTKAGDFTDAVFDVAKQLKEADEVVVAAPYWDFSFPSKLKVYLEHACAQGVTFKYSDEGIPTGLCQGTRLYYVTTAGGYIGEYDFGFEQMRAAFTLYFGYEEAVCFKAEGLDIITNDADAIMAEALANIAAADLA